MKIWNLEADVLVVGSGGGALTAAILAHDYGARTVVMERSTKVGGTTAVSGGAIWTPLNSHMKEHGISDSREEALTYCLTLTEARADEILVESFVDTAHVMADYLEANTPVKLSAMTMPDYHPQEAGAKRGRRTLEPDIYDASVLGAWKDKVRPNAIPFMNHQTTEEQYSKYKMMVNAANFPADLIMERMDKSLVGRGYALIAMLLKACLDRGITILMETRARELIMENGRVVGARAEREGKDFLVKSPGGVILGCGGFEWNEELKKKYLQGVITHPHSPPFNEGDGIIMAAEVGADLMNMHEVWWMPALYVPGDEYEGRPYSYCCVTERSCPHSVLVNRRGRRFVNESASYNEMMKAFFHINENGTGYRNLPCWQICDSQYRENYTLVTSCPGDPDPEWLIKDDTIEGLAKKIDVDAKGLVETVNRFNGFAEKGEDLDFERGKWAYDQYMGDMDRGPGAASNLGTISKTPFYAVQIHAGAIGTKGGPRTDKDARVLNVRGKAIPGLYAIGNTMAGISGPGYYGPGGTIGPAMAFGYRAGIHAANELKKQK